MLIQQNKNMISTDLDFVYDKRNNLLYIYAQNPAPSTITLAYSRELHYVEDIYEPFWQDKLRRLALAMTKEVLGRIRSKYTSNSATFTLDGPTLLAEAQTELQDIRNYLDSNSDILFAMD